MADPQAMVQAAAAAQVTQLIGLPERLYPLSQATVFLAEPRSRTRSSGPTSPPQGAARREPVPLRLRNAVTPLMKATG